MMISFIITALLIAQAAPEGDVGQRLSPEEVRKKIEQLTTLSKKYSAVLNSAEQAATFLDIWFVPEKTGSTNEVRACPNARVKSGGEIVNSFTEVAMEIRQKQWKEAQNKVTELQGLSKEITDIIDALDPRDLAFQSSTKIALGQLQKETNPVELKKADDLIKQFDSQTDQINSFIAFVRNNIRFLQDAGSNKPTTFLKIGRVYPEDPMVWIQRFEDKVIKRTDIFSTDFDSQVYRLRQEIVASK